MAPVEKDGNWFYIDEKGETVLELEVEWACSFQDDGYAEVKKDEKWGIICLDGSFLVDPQFDMIG